jgi:hypothetical protein
MQRMVLVLLLTAGGLALHPLPAHAADLTDNPECQRMFLEQARPVYQQMMWYMSHVSDQPLTPQARPVVTGWPYSAYGPGNGYGPGTPYGPAFGPWGYGSVGPGFGGPGGYGFTPRGVGGPPDQFASAVVGPGLATLGTLPQGLAVSSIANQLATAPGGLGALANADLVGLGGLGQSLTGNVLSASALQQALIGNQIGGAALRQGVVGNRLSAASLNATLAGYPSTVGNNIGTMLASIAIFWNSICPGAVPEDPALEIRFP